jgi:antitoxin component of MazEF toxin-antitoxin module
MRIPPISATQQRQVNISIDNTSEVRTESEQRSTTADLKTTYRVTAKRETLVQNVLT